MDAKVERRLGKLLALAERGVEGEKDTAQRMLSNLLQKHGMTLDDFTGDAREMCWFKYGGGPAFRSLMNQIVLSVIGRERDRYTSPGHRSCLGAETDPAERAEILLKYSVYAKGLKEQLDTALEAFVHRHHIFADSDDDNSDEKERTPEELARIRRMFVMANAMPSVDVRQGLEQF
jgi:hypothetical protein